MAPRGGVEYNIQGGETAESNDQGGFTALGISPGLGAWRPGKFF